MDASNEISLSSNPLSNDEQDHNSQMMSYFEWLTGLREKLVDHLTDNVEQYPSLMKKFNILVSKNDQETLREMISSITTKPVKYQKDEYGYELTDSPFISYRGKLYFYSEDKAKSATVRCDLDLEMREKNYVRKHIPVFDRHGVEIPLEEVIIGSGDVISIENIIQCQLYDIGGNIGAGLKRIMRSVVILRQADKANRRATKSPYKDFEL